MEKNEITKDGDGNIVLYGSYFHVSNFDLNNVSIEPDELEKFLQSTGQSNPVNESKFVLSTELTYDGRNYYSIDHYPYNEKGLNEARNEVMMMTRTLAAKLVLEPNTFEMLDHKVIVVSE